MESATLVQIRANALQKSMILSPPHPIKEKENQLYSA